MAGHTILRTRNRIHSEIARASFAYKKHKPARHHKPTKTECETPTPTNIPCCQPGSPGFQSSGQIHAFASSFTNTFTNTTAQQCCEACFNASNCVEWYFVPNQCFMNSNADTCNNQLTIPINNNSYSNGGIMRCDAD
ncbi:2019_t:CDS:2, partial [Dentiscutata heterogama]